MKTTSRFRLFCWVLVWVLLTANMTLQIVILRRMDRFDERLDAEEKRPVVKVTVDKKGATIDADRDD